MYHSFRHYLEKESKKSRTINGYVKDIELFTHFLDGEGVKIAKVRDTHIRKFNLHLNEMGYSNHTIARKNSSLRLYLKFLRREGVMSINPMEDIKQPRLTKREVALTTDDIAQMIKQAESPRDKLLVSLAFHEKLRISEILKLKRDSYKQMQGILYLNNKAILICDESRKLLEEMLQAEDADHLMVNQHKKPLTVSGAYFILKGLFEKISKPDLRPVDLYRKKEG